MVQKKNNQALTVAGSLNPPGNLAEYGLDTATWDVLCQAIFPSAQSAESIMLAVKYCKSRGLDIMKKPVHVVPMWNSALSRTVETIWPSINEIRVTAHRTETYAGCDAIEFGPTQTQSFKDGTGNQSASCGDVRFPEYAQMTVYKIVAGQRVAFVGPKVMWTEIFSGQKGVRVPNSRWQENPFQMIEKCAEAAALRRAFPEELGNVYAAEEMEGQILEGNIESVDTGPGPKGAADVDAQFIAEFKEWLDDTTSIENVEKGRTRLLNRRGQVQASTYDELVKLLDNKVDVLKAANAQQREAQDQGDEEETPRSAAMMAISEAGEDKAALKVVRRNLKPKMDEMSDEDRTAVENALQKSERAANGEAKQ